MSAVLSNSSSFDAAEIPDFASVIISAYAEETSPALRLMLLYAVLGVTCLPLLLVAFYFSSPRIRRTPLFKIVVFDILLGVAVSCWMTTMTLRFLLKPLTDYYSRTSFIAIPFVTFISPWMIDLVLLLRLYAVFPAATTPRRTICVVFAFAACAKAGRLGCGIAFFTLWIPTVPQDPWAALYSSNNTRFAHSSWLKAAAACDVIDHIFVAACFLWKIRVIIRRSRHRAVHPKDSATITDRLRMLFYIALGNFVFPAVFNIIVLLAICIDRINFMVPMFLEPVDMYVNIFGVVFATIWSSSYSPTESQASLANTHTRSDLLRGCGDSGILTIEVSDGEQADKMGGQRK